jgi:excisionase family DNA binding protein
MNVREAAEYLGIGERVIKELVDSGELPAYKIGGTFLRFKESQLLSYKTALYDDEAKPVKKAKKTKKDTPRVISVNTGDNGIDAVKDFLYFNDFYILSAIFIVIAIVLMIAT